MSTDNNTGIQMRALAQRIENEADAEQLQRPPNPDMNPTVELHKTKEEAIKEFVRKNSPIVKSKEGLWAFIHGKSHFSGLQSPLDITNGNRNHNKPLELI